MSSLVRVVKESPRDPSEEVGMQPSLVLDIPIIQANGTDHHYVAARRSRRRGAAAAFTWTVLVAPLSFSPRVRGLIALNLVCLLCASAFTVLRTVEREADAWVFNALRFSLAAAGMSPWWRGALQDEHIVRAGVDIGFWAAGGKSFVVGSGQGSVKAWWAPAIGGLISLCAFTGVQATCRRV